LERSGFTADPSAPEGVQRNPPGFIPMIHGQQSLFGHHLHAQFFRDLPFQAGLEGLPFFLFTTGELPQAFEVRALGALADEYFAFPPNEGGRYVNM
jgi:hypothetical protein